MGLDAYKKFWVTGKSGKCPILRLNKQVVFFGDDKIFLIGIKLSPINNVPINLVQNRETCRGSTLFCTYGVTKEHRTDILCIYQCRFGVCQFSFSEICRQSRHFKNDYHWITPSFYERLFTQSTPQWLSSKINQWWIAYSNISITKPNSAQTIFSRWDSVRWIHSFVKVATGHFPTGDKFTKKRYGFQSEVAFTFATCDWLLW